MDQDFSLLKSWSVLLTTPYASVFQAALGYCGEFHVEVTITLVEISGIVKAAMFQVPNLLNLSDNRVP